MGRIRGYLGTYASPESQGIYTFTLDERNGALSQPQLWFRAPDCKYLSLRDGVLAAPVQRPGGAGLCLLRREDKDRADQNREDKDREDKESGCAGVVAELLTEQTTSCHVVRDGAFIYTANYHEGTVSVYRECGEKSGKLVLAGRIENGREAGCHQVLIHGDYLLVPCLLLDRVKMFDRRQGYAPVGELIFPDKTGPRHGIFDRMRRRFFLVSELSNQVFTYGITGPAAFELTGCYEIFSDSLFSNSGGPGDWEKRERGAPSVPYASAAIRLSPDENYLYISTRFADCITVFRVEGTALRMVQQIGSGGEGPRDIALTRDGNFLLAANRTGGGLVSFRRDGADGILGPECGRVPAPEAVSIVLEETAAEEQRQQTTKIGGKS